MSPASSPNPSAPPVADGIHAEVPDSAVEPHVRRRRAFYRGEPGAALVRAEFYFYSREAWQQQGLPLDADIQELFQFDPPAQHSLGQLGWCEAALAPAFPEEVLEDRGRHELVQDFAGRQVLYFKGERNGFMPEYVAHPVRDRQSWEELVAPRLDPATASRWQDLEPRMEQARQAAGRGHRVVQNLIGGYMYLRSLIGPTELPYMLYDDPELVHRCMRAWLELADAVTARHQAHVTLDEIFLAEDICYNHGPLISADMMREFLLPYYQQLIANARERQIDRHRHLYVHVDTDGFADPVIELYRSAIGMDRMSPFEVAAGSDVVAIGARHPWLRMSGGIDKRVLAAGPAAIDRMVERLLPVLRARGGWYPTCDHGVPAEVSLDNYLHYRRRCIELGG